MIKKAVILFLGLFLSNFFVFQMYTYDALIGKEDQNLYGKYRLQAEADRAFNRMHIAALESGINIQVVSSNRNFSRQNGIWTRKYNNFTTRGMSPKQAIREIIKYSTIPGTSRHHWGTEIDIIDGNATMPKRVLLPRNFDNGGVYQNLKKWMDEHAEGFGFYLVYTDAIDRNGFKYEPWHYSYKPIAKEMLYQYLQIDICGMIQTGETPGREYFTDEFVDAYINNNILGINPDLK